MSKYRNRPVTIDGIRFDSQAEGNRYLILKSRHRVGEIHKLRTHPRYTLLDAFECKGVKYRAIVYEGDFEYIENGVTVVEDVKGKVTQTFALKMKLFIKRYGETVDFRIVEV
jgi:hypothetical protein